MKRLPALLLAFALLPGFSQTRQEKTPPFRASEYPSAKFEVTKASYPLGELQIKIIEVKKRKPDAELPTNCRAWIDITREAQLLKRIYFEDIEAVGWRYGLFVPRRQPLPGYFLAVTIGDYDGRLILVTQDGKARDIPGGRYFLSASKRYLMSSYNSDEPYELVYDTLLRKVAAKGEFGDQEYQWFLDPKGYFVGVKDRPDEIRRLDLRRGTFVKELSSQESRGKARRVPYEFDPTEMKDCTAAAQ